MARVNVYELNVYDDGTGAVTEWERDEATGGLIFRCRRFLDEGETRRAAYVLSYPYAPLPASLELPAPRRIGSEAEMLAVTGTDFLFCADPALLAALTGGRHPAAAAAAAIA